MWHATFHTMFWLSCRHDGAAVNRPLCLKRSSPLRFTLYRYFTTLTFLSGNPLFAASGMLFRFRPFLSASDYAILALAIQ